MEQLISNISLILGSSWASGINLYATILVLGISSNSGAITLPQELDIVSNPLIIFVAGVMYGVEFFADKIPGVDSAWDALHTFIRIPAGALLAYSAAGEVAEPVAIAAALIGGTLTASTHTTKAGSRALINTSPEPITNIAASVGEDAVVFGGLWLAFKHPVIFIIFLILFIVFMIWALPKIWKGIKKVFGFLFKLIGLKKSEDVQPMPQTANSAPISNTSNDHDIEVKLEKLSNMYEKGLISKEDFEAKKKDLLDKF